LDAVDAGAALEAQALAATAAAAKSFAWLSQPRQRKYHSGATPQAIISAMANG
jgi:hypothetical protein